MHGFLKKIGLSGTVASVLMIIFGLAILIKPELLNYLIAAYLILVGIITLLVPK